MPPKKLTKGGKETWVIQPTEGDGKGIDFKTFSERKLSNETFLVVWDVSTKNLQIIVVKPLLIFLFSDILNVMCS